MSRLISIFYDICVCSGIIPLIIGIRNYKKLDKPIKLFLGFVSTTYILTIYSQLAYRLSLKTHLIYYLMFIVIVIGYSVFFNSIFNSKLAKLILLILALISGGIIYFDINKNGVRAFFSQAFIFTDVVYLVCSLYILKNFKIQKPIKILLLGIAVNFCYDILSTFISSFFYNFLQNKIFQLVFFGISPLFMLLFFAFQSYAFYISGKYKKPTFNKFPDFN